MKRRCQMVERRRGRDDAARRRLAVLDARLDARARRDDVPAAERPLRRAAGADRPRGLPPARRRAEVGVGVGGVPQDVRRRMDPTHVVEFLLLVARRSPAASCSACARPSATLPGSTRGRRARPVPSGCSGRIRAELEFCDVAELLPAACTRSSTASRTASARSSEAIAAQYFRNAAGRAPRRSHVARRRARLTRCGSTSATARRFTYDAPVRESQNELRAVPDERRPPAAHLVSGDDDPGVARVLVHRLLGHPRRRVRRARAARVARGRSPRRRSRRAVRRCSPRRRTSTSSAASSSSRSTSSTSCRPPRRLGAGRRRRGAPRARELAGPDVVSVVLAIHRRVGELDHGTSPASTYVGVEVEEVLGRGRGRVPGLRPPRGRDVPQRRHPRPLRLGLPVHDATTRPARTPTPRQCGCRRTPGSRRRSRAADWLALDPTNAAEVGLRHVKIGHGRDYDDVPPLRGVFGGAATPSLGVTVDIRRLAPRAAAADAAACRALPPSSGSTRLGHVARGRPAAPSSSSSRAAVACSRG